MEIKKLFNPCMCSIKQTILKVHYNLETLKQEAQYEVSQVFKLLNSMIGLSQFNRISYEVSLLIIICLHSMKVFGWIKMS